MIKWFSPEVGKDDLRYVKKAILNNYINDGNLVTLFESSCKKLLNVKYAQTTTSGTISLYIALKVLGIGYNDEVLVPNISFIAAANAVSMTGAKPVFVNVNKKNLLIDLIDLKKFITKKTKAIIPVHVSGRGNNIIEIVKFAKKNYLHIIEDAAEAFCSKNGNFFLGTFGDIGCFSFSPNKIITTGQGGLIVTSNHRLNKKIVMFKNQGRFGIGTGGDDTHFTIGSNLRMTNLQAAVGLTQLKKLRERIKKLKQNYNFYKKNISNIKGIKLFNFKKEELPLWTDVHCTRRDELINFLKSKKVDCRKFWLPMSTQKAYQKKIFKNKKIKSDKFYKELFWLPSSFNLTSFENKYICNLIKIFFKKNEK
jgi:perosamine synthetase